MIARIYRQAYLLAMRWLCFFAVALCLAMMAGAVAMMASVLAAILIPMWALVESAVPLTLYAMSGLGGWL